MTPDLTPAEAADLVKRLTTPLDDLHYHWEPSPLEREAAAHIERQDATIARQAEWLREHAATISSYKKTIARLSDDIHGTPCEQIRHAQELEAAQARAEKAEAALRKMFKALNSDPPDGGVQKDVYRDHVIYRLDGQAMYHAINACRAALPDQGAEPPESAGWIEWKGGKEAPINVLGRDEITVRCRNGKIDRLSAVQFSMLCVWEHWQAPSDIIAYKLAPAAQEPQADMKEKPLD